LNYPVCLICQYFIFGSKFWMESSCNSKHTRERRLKKQTKLNTPNILVNAILKNKQN
jgi:hypothetical protein